MNMGNLNKLALTAQEALQQTIVIASENESSQAEPIHMLKALLESKENNLSAIIKRIGAEPFQLQANVDAEIQRMPKVSGNPGMMSGVPGPALMNLIDNAVKIAEKLGDSYATSEHLLIALSEEKGAAGKILTTAGVTRKSIEDIYSFREIMETRSLQKIVEAIRNKDYDTAYFYLKRDHFDRSIGGRSVADLVEQRPQTLRAAEKSK